ncbi:MAG: type III pantothenate kinase [Planctomycetota bacterium]|nr:type III pantothenate kinase [Planctomycetota bacterium]MDA1178484.1 type III pantothenate kinase [Planctomycetota bacterium]
MESSTNRALVAVDIGNSSIDIGLFKEGLEPTSGVIPEPAWRTKIPANEADAASLLEAYNNVPNGTSWHIASVNQPGLAKFLNWMQRSQRTDDLRVLSADDLPIPLAVREPNRLGLDRRAAALAANCLRDHEKNILFIDFGTAITVNLIDTTGCFQGGTILPGIGLASRSLAEGTDGLPRLKQPICGPPGVIGNDTTSAIQSGIFWGIVGGIHEIVSRIEQILTEPHDILITGGGADAFANELRFRVRKCPDLVLSGIAISAYRFHHTVQKNSVRGDATTSPRETS